MNDSQLLSDYAQNGSERAFRDLVARHIDLVYSAALRQCGGNAHDAKEVTQMVFIDLARKAGELHKHPLLVAWLHRSTRWASAKLHRGESRRLRKELLAGNDPLLKPEPAAAEVDWNAVRPVLDEALDSLSESERRAILLRFFENQDFEHIGSGLGLPANTARMRVSRALDKLAAALSKKGIRSTSAALGLALAANSVQAAPLELASGIANTALAQAAAVSAGGGLLGFLAGTKLQLSLASAVALGLGGGLAYSLNASANEARLLEAILQENEALRAEISSNKTRLSSFESQGQEAATKAAAANAPQAKRFKLDHIIRKGELDMEWAAFFRRLHLKPAELDSLKGLIVERNQALHDAKKLAENTPGIGELWPSEEKKLKPFATAAVDARIAILIGPDGLERLRNYEANSRWIYPDEDPAPLAATAFMASGTLNMLRPEALEERAAHLRQLYEQYAGDYEDRCFVEQVPLPLPEEFVRQARAAYPKIDWRRFENGSVAPMFNARLIEMHRQAAAAGKLYLKKNSALEYGVARTPKGMPALPAKGQ